MISEFDNRRKFHRINFDGQVNLAFTNDSYNNCQVKNLCLTGMFVTGNFQQLHSMKCLVNLFHRAKSEDIHLCASAKVVWSNEEGVALNFTSMTFASYMSLLTALIHEADEPVIILNEFPKICPFEIRSEDFISESNVDRDC